jgi:uncharacterized protein (DUF2235 family)
MPKNIVVFSDGTGQDGGVRPEQRLSNVYKFYRASRIAFDNAIDPSEQVALYDPGLGTDIGATALTAPVRFIQKLLGSVTGRGITRNIAECYEFIINHYRTGDRIFLIGFSRGAYTVRCIANLLMLCGVPTEIGAGEVPLFRKAVRDIADEGVNDVLEHGAGHPRGEFEDERVELARRFRRKYGSGDDEKSNAAPHFIGVFDTVASLGAKGLRRHLIQAGLGIAIVIALTAASILPGVIVSGLLRLLVGLSFWWALLTFVIAFVLIAGGYLWRRQRLSYRKTIRDYPNPGDVRSHYAEWKGENFDRLLSQYVHYARSANAIDETRKDFDRVAWGGVQKGVPDKEEGHPRLIQLWFAGNHSDIGGSYPEVESRLSDIALAWMIEHATVIPNGLKVGPVWVNGTKMPGTGDVGDALHIYPSADGVQHCEIAGMRDTLDDRAEHMPAFMRKFMSSMNWEVKIRTIDPKAPVHPTVRDRFELPSVVQCAGGPGKYRPKALEGHEDFKKYYSPPDANQKPPLGAA